ncbi:lonely Cys domain-containing protein [Streptomyces sp. PG2]
MAHRLNRPVWSTSGNPDTQKADDGKVRVFLEKRTGLPVGDWIPSRPDEVMSDPTTQTTDVPAWERDMVSYTVVADDDPTLQIGRAVLDPSDFATREATYRKLNQDYLLHRYVSSARALKQGVRPRVGAAPGEPVHHVFMHGTPEYVQVPQKDGSVYPASGEEITGWLKRRPSVSRLGDRGWINFDACWTAAPTATARTSGPTPTPPSPGPSTRSPRSPSPRSSPTAPVSGFGPATASMVTTSIPTPANPAGSSSTTCEAGSRTPWSTIPSRSTRKWPISPAPAGLHTGPDPVPGHTLDTTLRLVRALRQTFGPRVGEDPSYHDLVRGIGAVERMRSDDPQLKDVAPFTLDLFKRAAAANRRDHGDGRVLLDAGAYRGVPRQGGHRTAGHGPQRLRDDPHARMGGGTVPHDAGPGGLHQASAAAAPFGPGGHGRDDAGVLGVRQGVRMVPVAARQGQPPLPWHCTFRRPTPRRPGGLQLVDLATTAFAAGHDAYNLLQLAAFHLTLRGAFDPHSRYVDSSGRVVGRNWGRQRPHQTSSWTAPRWSP